ncbi:hypothetical protein BN2475_1390011 [Paraburkholderia ribeironis]|uniref:Uncharacterized protein n=1 Tax=Paraburkholderia ribeironis TaxID=1247936 RepID=A0A1N7SQ20_9BURK|nr:hypothetical protein [Paraburkholderia ribeironis]SIT49410.1 hypothetical protein BN2475_1390011 [Paraburkholderia ribeironis]
METSDGKPEGESVPPAPKSSSPGPKSNPELEGYLAGLAHDPEKSPYKDDASDREWERGYRKGWKDSRLWHREWWRLKFWGVPAVIGSLMLGFLLGRNAWDHGDAKKELGARSDAGYPVARSNLSGVEERLDRLNTTIEKSCQSQPVTVVTPSEVRDTVTAQAAKQGSILSIALGNLIDDAAKTGKGVIKDVSDLKTKIVGAAVDSTTKIADGTAEALIKRFISKEGEKTMPENIQITVTQNNAATPAVRVPGRPPSQTTVCTGEKK